MRTVQRKDQMLVSNVFTFLALVFSIHCKNTMFSYLIGRLVPVTLWTSRQFNRRDNRETNKHPHSYLRTI